MDRRQRPAALPAAARRPRAVAPPSRLDARRSKPCTALGLVGLVSFDFLLTDEIAYLLEANPRPSATIDVFDDAQGSLFCAHLAACRGEMAELPPQKGARAAAILYADAAALPIGAPDWPAWSADRPRPGVRILAIDRLRPSLAVAKRDEARQSAPALGRTGDAVWTSADRERNKNAEVHRPRPQRIGPRSEAR
jgi:predicted ATP-grasp superfamily ATP-dependent carboligase